MGCDGNIHFVLKQINQGLSQIILGGKNVLHGNWDMIIPLKIRGSRNNGYTTTGVLPVKLTEKGIKICY